MQLPPLHSTYNCYAAERANFRSELYLPRTRTYLHGLLPGDDDDDEEVSRDAEHEDDEVAGDDQRPHPGLGEEILRERNAYFDPNTFCNLARSTSPGCDSRPAAVQQSSSAAFRLPRRPRRQSSCRP